MKEINHLFFYGNEYHPGQVFLSVSSGDIFQIAELSIMKALFQLLMNEYYNYTDESDKMIHHYFC